MRYASTDTDEKLDYYELALMIAQSQVPSPLENWPEFIDRLSRICDAFARARYHSSRTGIYIDPIETMDEIPEITQRKNPICSCFS